MGLLAGGNDMKLLERTGTGRDINRHYFDGVEIVAALARPVVRDLLDLIRLRNTHPGFSGTFEWEAASEETLRLRWRAGRDLAELQIDFSQRSWEVRYTAEGIIRRFGARSTASADSAQPQGGPAL